MVRRNKSIHYSHKESFNWISLLRLPDFVKQSDFEWAIKKAEHKKKLDFSKVKFFTYNEGLCMQCMHVGSYDNEPKINTMLISYSVRSIMSI